MKPALALLLPATLGLLAGCSSVPETLTLDARQLAHCPQNLHSGQTMTVALPSNPTTGYRWQVLEAAPQILAIQGAELYQSDTDGELVGAGGQSRWRYKVTRAGSGRLLMHYRQPWDEQSAPAQIIDCQLQAR